jgi:hypothetical protein
LAASAVAASFLFAGSAGASVLFSENFSGAIPGGGSSAGGAYPTGTIPGTQFAVTEDNVDVLGVLNGTSFSCVDNPAGNCLDLVGNEDGGAIASTTTFDLIAGHTYTVTFGAILQGYAAGQGFTSFDVGLGSQSRLESADGTAQQFSLTFTPPVDESGAQLSFTTVTPGDSVHGAVLDNIVLSGGVPEPAAWATILLGFGLIGTTLRRRRGGALAL